MKKKILSLVLVAILLCSLLTMTACSPFDVVKKLTDKMVQTQKYTTTAEFDTSVNIFITTIDAHVKVVSKVDGTNNYISIDSKASAGDNDNANVNFTDEYYYYVNNAGKRQEMELKAGQWVETTVSSDDNAAEDEYGYLTMDFDWEKFTEDYFDQDGNTLTLKKEKYDDFIPGLSSVLDYFKVSATGNSMTISYGVSALGSTFTCTLKISNIGSTTVKLPNA